MAGHSQFKNIMHRKGAQDAKRAKVFTKIIRELTTSARTGSSDPSSNSRLRAAMLAAREANMPKDTIDRAIKRGAGGEGDASYEEVRYEGYGPGSVAIIVEALTDNRNRTASEIRTAFTKHGGTLGETNSVSFMFDRVGSIRYPAAVASADTMFEAALDAGADDVFPPPRATRSSVRRIAWAPCARRWKASSARRRARGSTGGRRRRRRSPTSMWRSRSSSCWKCSRTMTTCSACRPITISPRM